MLELIPRMGSRRYLLRRDGIDVTELDLAWFREAGRFTIDGVTHEIAREGLLSGAFTLTRDGTVIARARKPSPLHRRFEVTHEGGSYDLGKAAWWGRRFDVRLAGTSVGSISPHHPFTRRASVDLPADMSLPVKVFVAALAVFLWNRDASAAAGNG